MQDEALSLDEINPFFFREPVAPLVAARKYGRKISVEGVLGFICNHAQEHERVLIEGAGGLLTPLGEGFSLLDIIRELDAKVILVAPNKLGVINQTLLTLKVLQRRAQVVLMRQKNQDPSAESNCAIIREFVMPAPVLDFPYLSVKKIPHRECRV